MRIYLDYAATTPVDPAVFDAMKPYFSRNFGNPSSLHFFGQEALAAVDEGREQIAKAIGADFREIIFTGSATESNNLALRGVIKESRIQNTKHNKFLNSKSYILNPRVIVSAIEHESILETCRDLEKEGVEIIYLPVNRDGIVNLKKLEESLNERTILVSVMYANNETGAIQPIKEIAEIIRDFRNSKREARNSKISNPKRLGFKNLDLDIVSDFGFKISDLTMHPLFHADAAQAFQFLDCDVCKVGVDLMTLSAHKIYGPKGIGALCVANRVQSLAAGVKKTTPNPKPHTLNPIITGGGQEFGLRSGTENVAVIVGFAKAVELAARNRGKESKRIEKLRDYFWQKIRKIEPKARLNNNALNRLPNILNVYFPSHDSQDLLVKLDLAGVAVSSGAACAARSLEPSYVLAACGFPNKRIKSSLRFSLGRFTTKEEIDEALKRILRVLK